MGCRACKTSHLGKNTLQNRRFLESNNADSGEPVSGSDTEGVLSPRTGWPLPLSAGAILATGNCLQLLLFLGPVALGMLSSSIPRATIGKLAFAWVRTGLESGHCTLCPPLLGSPPIYPQPSILSSTATFPQAFLTQAWGLTLL